MIFNEHFNTNAPSQLMAINNRDTCAHKDKQIFVRILQVINIPSNITVSTWNKRFAKHANTITGRYKNLNIEGKSNEVQMSSTKKI